MVGNFRKFVFGVVLVLASLITPSTHADVKITAINDLSFGSYGGSGDLSSQDDICVYNSASQNYTVTVTSNNGQYALASGGNTIPFELRFKESGGIFTQLTYGVASAFSGADTVSTSCGGLTNASYQVKILQGDLLSARPGSYSTTLTILISPN